jgi:hypothetical protein
MKDFKQHIQNFKQKLIDREPFAFARYSDGEVNVMKNLQFKLDNNLIEIGNKFVSTSPYQKADYKHFDPVLHKDFKDHLVQAFQHKQHNYYKGVSCRCCVGDEDFNFQMQLNGNEDHDLTWANLWINGNYSTFLEEILPVLQTYDAVMVCHTSANLERLQFVMKDFRVGYNAMVQDVGVIGNIKKWIDDNNVTGKLFLFSASSFSNLAIYELYKHNPSNTYIDIGTTLVPYMDMPPHRSYLQEYWYNQHGNDLNKNCIW